MEKVCQYSEIQFFRTGFLIVFIKNINIFKQNRSRPFTNVAQRIIMCMNISVEKERKSP